MSRREGSGANTILCQTFSTGMPLPMPLWPPNSERQSSTFMVMKKPVMKTNSARCHMALAGRQIDGLAGLEPLWIQGGIGREQGLEFHVVLTGNGKSGVTLFDGMGASGGGDRRKWSDPFAGDGRGSVSGWRRGGVGLMGETLRGHNRRVQTIGWRLDPDQWQAGWDRRFQLPAQVLVFLL